MATIQMKWSEMNDDDFAYDDVATGLVQIDGDFRTSVAYEGSMKVTTRKKVCSRVHRKSAMSARRKEEMIASSDAYKGDYKSDIDKEVFFELPRSLRKLDEDIDDPVEPVTQGLQSLWRDSVKDKFNQLRALDGEILPETGLQAPEGEEPAAPAPITSTTFTGRGPRPVKEDCIVRVTNLSEEATEDDLGNLFGKIGKVERIFLARDKETRKSKGYAFITYAGRQTAEEAIRKLDRHGHDCLLLRVEWAKPSIKTRD